eukprot:1889503-Amphidinium_carterae.1
MILAGEGHSVVRDGSMPAIDNDTMLNPWVWTTQVGCAAHDCHNALKWGCKVAAPAFPPDGWGCALAHWSDWLWLVVKPRSGENVPAVAVRSNVYKMFWPQADTIDEVVAAGLWWSPGDECLYVHSETLMQEDALKRVS